MSRETAGWSAQAAVNEVERLLPRDTWEATVTRGGLDPQVLIDTDEDTATFSTGKAVPAIATTDIPSTGQRVLVRYGTVRGKPTGHVWIVGIIGGLQRSLGFATTEDDQIDITTEVDLEESAGERLEIATEILHPNRLVVVTAHVRVEQTAGTPTPILRAKAIDDEGNTINIGICAEAVGLGAGENVVLEGEAPMDAPDPGEYTIYATLANGGSGTLATLAGASAGSDTWIRAHDAGFAR